MIFLRSPALRQKNAKSFLNRRSQRSQRVTFFIKSHRRSVGLRCLNRDQQATKRSLVPNRPLVLKSQSSRSQPLWTGKRVDCRQRSTFKDRRQSGEVLHSAIFGLSDIDMPKGKMGSSFLHDIRWRITPQARAVHWEKLCDIV
jgi:hypothetical protein